MHTSRNLKRKHAEKSKKILTMKKNLFVICLLFSLAVSFGQVNLQTGTPAFSIPILGYSDVKSSLGLSISLDYSPGSGTKVAEMASNVGIGWVLNCSSVIIRKQNGEPDDQKSKDTYSYIPFSADLAQLDLHGNPFVNGVEKNVYGDGLLYASTVANGCPVELAYQPQYGDLSPSLERRIKYKPSQAALTDKEHDVFFLSVNGKSISFIVVPGEEFATPLEDTRFLIKPLFETIPETNVRTRISGFTVITDNGIKYSFRSYELTALFAKRKLGVTEAYGATGNPIKDALGNWQPGSPFAVYTYTQYENVEVGDYVINKWFLSEIENPRTNEKIVFNYDKEVVDYITDINVSASHVDIPDNQKSNIIRSEEKVKVITRRIASVAFPDEQRVDFTYDSQDRLDLAGDKALKEINVSKSGKEYFKYILGYAYFGKTDIKEAGLFPPGELKYARLCLRSFQKTGANEMAEPPYTFEYNLPDPLSQIMPPRLSFMYTKDYWGYMSSYSPLNNDAEFGHFSISGAYNIITDYDQLRTPGNDFAKTAMLQKITYPMGGSMAYDYEYNACNNTNAQGRVVGGGGVRVAKVIVHDGTTNNDKVSEFKYTNEDGSSSAWGFETPLLRLKQTLRQYKSSYSSVISGTIGNTVSNYAVNNLFSGGYTEVTDLGKVITKSPTSGFSLNSLLSSLILQTVFYLFTPDFKEYHSDNYYYYSFNSGNPLPLQYSRVEVQEKSGGMALGKTVYEYRSPADSGLAMESPTYSPPFSAKQRLLNWRYGIPKRISTFDDNGQLVKEVISEYDDKITALTEPKYQSQKCLPLTMHAAIFNDFDYNSIPASDISSETYGLKKGHTELRKTLERIYNKKGNFIETVTNYTYNPSNFLLQKKSVTLSDNKVVEEQIYYAEDYAAISPGISKMIASNIVAVPVAEEIWLTNNAGDRFLNKSVVKDIVLTPNNDLALGTLYEMQSSAPVAESQIGVHDPARLIRNNSVFKSTKQLQYNNNGLIAREEDQGGNVKSFIYDYNQRLPVAVVSNANPEDIAFTSFETSSNESWVFAATAINVNEGFCGNGSYFMTDPSNGNPNVISKSGLRAGITYAVTYWLKDGGTVSVNNTTDATVLAHARGWTLYKKSITGVTQISISGTGVVDELRLYPESAQMQTFTYDAYLGKTAECDINNRIVYYEYDELGRMRYVMDVDKNIIKMYEYNYKR